MFNAYELGLENLEDFREIMIFYSIGSYGIHFTGYIFQLINVNG